MSTYYFGRTTSSIFGKFWFDSSHEIGKGELRKNMINARQEKSTLGSEHQGARLLLTTFVSGGPTALPF